MDWYYLHNVVHIMLGVSSRFVAMFSRLLERDERDVVIGDLLESGASGWKASGDVFGLVVRRQFGPWLDWRPWLGVACIILPLSILLGRVSRHWGQGAAAYLWVLGHGGDLSVLHRTIWATSGDATNVIEWCVLNAATLALWSFASGWVLAAVSPRTVWTSTPLFYLALILGSVSGDSIGRTNNTQIFSPFGYGSIVPAIVGAFLVVASTLWGIYRSARSIALPASVVVAASVAAAALTYRAALSLEVSLAPWLRSTQHNSVRGLLTLAVGWPIGYIAAETCVKARGALTVPRPHCTSRLP